MIFCLCTHIVSLVPKLYCDLLNVPTYPREWNCIWSINPSIYTASIIWYNGLLTIGRITLLQARRKFSNVGILCIVTGHWPVGWTIIVSGYAKLVQWLSLCYHVSYEPGSIGLLGSKAVSMTASWQSVWQPYIHTNVKDSQPDHFIVVSLTTLQAIKWCQAFCCDGCGAVHLTNTESKVDGLYCDKNYVQVAFSHTKNKFKL